MDVGVDRSATRKRQDCTTFYRPSGSLTSMYLPNLDELSFRVVLAFPKASMIGLVARICRSVSDMPSLSLVAYLRFDVADLTKKSSVRTRTTESHPNPDNLPFSCPDALDRRPSQSIA